MTEPRLVTSTADLTPRGIAGYSKGIASAAALLGAILAAVVPYVDPGSDWARWVGIGIAVCGVIATVVIPNPVEPVQVVTPPDVIAGVVTPPVKVELDDLGQPVNQVQVVPPQVPPTG